MPTLLFNEQPMPFSVRLAGQGLAVLHATKAAFFIVLVWVLPSYAIRPPPRANVHHRSSRRRASVDTTSSETPTLVDEVVADSPEHSLGHKRSVEFGDLTMHERTEEEQKVKCPKKKRSQIFSQWSSSVSPVAKRLAAPAKKLSASVPKKLAPRTMVTDAQAKYSSIISNVHDRISRPGIKRAATISLQPMRKLPIIASCSLQKIVSPVKAPNNWLSLKKQGTF